jgi:hypothetical protein
MKHPETIMDVGDEIAYFGTNKNGVFNSRWMALMGYQCDMFGIQLAIQTKIEKQTACYWNIDGEFYHQFMEIWKYHWDRFMDILGCFNYHVYEL